MSTAERVYIRSDGLLGHIEFGGGVTFIGSFADTVNFVVDRSTVVVSHLTSASNSPLNVRRMPSADTSNLAETFVRLARKLLGTPTGGDTVESVSLGDGNAVNHLILLEDGADFDRLLEQTMAESNLVCDASTIDLNFHQVRLLLLQWGLADLGMGKNSNHCAVLLHALHLTSDGLTLVLGILLRVLSERLSL